MAAAALGHSLQHTCLSKMQLNAPYPILPTRKFLLYRSPAKLDLHQCQRYGFSLASKFPRGFPVRANSYEDWLSTSLAPLQLESPVGRYLTVLLHKYPELVPAAAEHELEIMEKKRVLDTTIQTPLSPDLDPVLTRRIKELKVQERQKALEEIIYILVIQQFVDAGIVMTPSLSKLVLADESWNAQVADLESVHPFEALELIREHLLLVLGERVATNLLSQSMHAQISKLPMHQIYAGSIVYGYFLKRLHNRFHLEKSFNISQDGLESFRGKNVVNQNSWTGLDVAAAKTVSSDLRGANRMSGSTGIMASRFLTYIVSFDVSSLRNLATVRTEESQSILSKHVRALFRGPEIFMSADGSTRGKSEASHVSFSRSRVLLLEAVAFGSFLWDAEAYVDSHYRLGS